MNYKSLIWDWQLSSVLIFVVYEVIWCITEHAPLFSNDYMVYITDFVYCSIFVFTSMSMCGVLSRLDFFKRFDFWGQTCLCVVTLMCNLVLAYLFENMYNRYLGIKETDLIFNSLYVFSVVATLFIFIHHTERFYRIIIRQKDELANLQRKVLKSKLDPHFVFNSLSILTELIHESPVAAEQYTIQFSRIYRHLLATLDHNSVSVGESLSLVNDYVDLQRYRVDGKINLYVGLQDNAMERKLFPLSLQTLVENAIKHNIPQKNETLYISILQLGTDDIVVENTKGKCSKDLDRMGIGLETLRERYRLEHLPEPIVKDLENSFVVRISMIDI